MLQYSTAVPPVHHAPSVYGSERSGECINHTNNTNNHLHRTHVDGIHEAELKFQSCPLMYIFGRQNTLLATHIREGGGGVENNKTMKHGAASR